MAFVMTRVALACGPEACTQNLSSRNRALRSLSASLRHAPCNVRARSVRISASYREDQEKKTVQERKTEVDDVISKWKKRKDDPDSVANMAAEEVC